MQSHIGYLAAGDRSHLVSSAARLEQRSARAAWAIAIRVETALIVERFVLLQNPAGRPDCWVGWPRRSVIKMGAELFVWNKATRLSKDGSERSEIESGVSWNGQHLVACRPHAFQLHMAASLCNDDEPKRFEDCDNVWPGEPTKLGHRWDRLRA